MSFVASNWQSLSENERTIWQNKAKEVERINPSMLTAEEKRKRIAKGKKNLIAEVLLNNYSIVFPHIIYTRKHTHTLYICIYIYIIYIYMALELHFSQLVPVES